MTTFFSATKVSNISHYFMNRYHHIPEGCVPRKPLSQTCQHEVQSERYQIDLIIQHKQITCTYVMCCSGELVHSETIVQLYFQVRLHFCASHHFMERFRISGRKMYSLPGKKWVFLHISTRLIFVGGRGTYRCSVGDDTVTFKVIGK